MLPRIISITIILMSLKTMAQDLSEYQWKNRLLLVLIDNEQQQAYQDQLTELKKELPGLKERKLRVITIRPELYKSGINTEKWYESTDLYDKYKREDGDFEVILIGLDGGVKLRQSELLKNEKLFAIIDGMPMRRAEMRRENSKN